MYRIAWPSQNLVHKRQVRDLSVTRTRGSFCNDKPRLHAFQMKGVFASAWYEDGCLGRQAIQADWAQLIPA